LDRTGDVVVPLKIPSRVAGSQALKNGSSSRMKSDFFMKNK
jgi:hypothetical protein